MTFSDNPYTSYYVNQAGSGIPGFSGVRFQRGRGIFSRLFKTSLLPLLKTIGGHVFSAGSNIAKDVMGGESIKESVKRNAASEGKKLLNKALVKLDKVNTDKKEQQLGSGLFTVDPLGEPQSLVTTTTRRTRRKKRRTGSVVRRKRTTRVKKKIKRGARQNKKRRVKKLPPAAELFK